MFFARLFGDWFDFSLSLEETLVHFIWWNTIDHLHYDVFLSKEWKILKRSILHSSFHFQLSLFNPELSNSSICLCNLCCPTILQRICLIKILVHIPFSIQSVLFTDSNEKASREGHDENMEKRPLPLTKLERCIYEVVYFFFLSFAAVKL